MKYCQCSNIHTYVKNYTSTHMGLINIISPEKLGDKKVREIELRTRFFSFHSIQFHESFCLRL